MSLGFIAAIGIVACVLALAGLVVVVGRPTGDTGSAPHTALPSALEELGYRSVAPHKWTRTLRGVRVDFDDEGGWKWTTRLPRYGIMQLRIVERQGSGMKSFGQGTFLTQDPDLDRRFVVASDRPSHTLSLLADHTVRRLLLKLPHVDLELHGDELVLYDADQVSFGRLREGRSDSEAQAEVHDHVSRVILSVMHVLYAQSQSVILEA